MTEREKPEPVSGENNLVASPQYSTFVAKKVNHPNLLIIMDEFDQVTPCGTRLSAELRNLAKETVPDPILSKMIELLPNKISGMTKKAALTVVSSGENEITLGDYLNIVPKVEYEDKWVSGDIVNVYLGMLKDAHGTILPVDPLIASSLAEGQESHLSLEQMLKTTNDRNQLVGCKHLWPVIVNKNHWILIAVDFAIKIITVYDSMNFGEKYDQQVNNIHKFYQKWQKFPKRVVVVNEAREANEGKNCGIYILLQASIVCFQLEFLLYNDMRMRIAYELATGALLEGKPTQEQIEIYGLKLMEYDEIIAKAKNEEMQELLREKEKEAKLAQDDSNNRLTGIDFIRFSAATMELKSKCPLKIVQTYIRQVERILPALRKACQVPRPVNDDSVEIIDIPVSPASITSLSDQFIPSKRVKIEDPEAMSISNSIEAEQSMTIEEEKRLRIPAHVKTYFLSAAKSVPSQWRNTEVFRRKLKKEMMRMAKGMPIDTTPLLPIDMTVRRRSVFNAMKKEPYCLFDEREQYSWPRLNQKKAEVSRATYEEGLSGDEREPPTKGPPFDKRYKVQCRLCGHLSASEKDFQAHILAFAHDEIYQRANKITNRFHPRIDTTNLTVPRQWSALYGQESNVPKDAPADEGNDFLVKEESKRCDCDEDDKYFDFADESESPDEQSMMEDVDQQALSLALREEEETKEEVEEMRGRFAEWLLNESKQRNSMEIDNIPEDKLSQESITTETSVVTQPRVEEFELSTPVDTMTAEIRRIRKEALVRSAYPLRNRTKDTE